MVAIKLAADFPLVLTFDGSVLELFEDVESNRIHISWIDKMELKTDKKGKHSLDIHTFGDSSLEGNEVDENAFPKVARLIADVQKAKVEFRFD
jgi:hypothetical protein